MNPGKTFKNLTKLRKAQHRPDVMEVRVLSTLMMAKLTLTVKLGVKSDELEYLKQFVIEQYS